MTISLVVAAAGLVLGILAALIWRRLSARLQRFDFWPSFRRLTQDLFATANGREFVSLYGQLLKLAARYIGRNVLLVAASSLPVILWIEFLMPPVVEYLNTAATGTWQVDPELTFYLALGAGSVGGMIVPRRSSGLARRSGTEASFPARRS